LLPYVAVKLQFYFFIGNLRERDFRLSVRPPDESADMWLAHIGNRTAKGGTAVEEEDYTAGMIAFAAPPNQHKWMSG
jgi:hypothetical protein